MLRRQLDDVSESVRTSLEELRLSRFERIRHLVVSLSHERIAHVREALSPPRLRVAIECFEVASQRFSSDAMSAIERM
jgi:hypothetical protein